MSTWVGQDGSFHDTDGDGPATLDDVDGEEEIATTGEFTGWTEPFTDWSGELLEGMGQYCVWNITDPYEPAEFPAIPFPPEHDEPAASAPPPSPPTHAQPESPLDTPAAPSVPTTPHFGPPPHGATRPRRGGSSSRAAPSSIARGTFAGYGFPLTDDNGHLLTDPHPSHRDWQAPMTYGEPVMTGFNTPFTDLEGQLLSGPGQYGTFTVEDPYDHRTFNDVNLQSEDLEGNPLYYYTDENMAPEEEYFTGADDGASQFGQALGSMFGSATGDTSGSWGSAGKDIASSIEQGSDSGDWGSALASIATSAAKVAIPAIVKATQGSGTPSATTPSTSPPSATPSPQATTTTPTTKPVAKSSVFAHQHQLLVLIQRLAKRYGIAVPRAGQRQA